MHSYWILDLWLFLYRQLLFSLNSSVPVCTIASWYFRSLGVVLLRFFPPSLCLLCKLASLFSLSNVWGTLPPICLSLLRIASLCVAVMISCWGFGKSGICSFLFAVLSICYGSAVDSYRIAPWSGGETSKFSIWLSEVVCSLCDCGGEFVVAWASS